MRMQGLKAEELNALRGVGNGGIAAALVPLKSPG